MNKTVMGLAILPFMAGAALAAQPLTDKQMDKVTAGHDFRALELTNSTFVDIAIQEPLLKPPGGPGSLVVGNVFLPIASTQVVWGIIH